MQKKIKDNYSIAMLFASSIGIALYFTINYDLYNYHLWAYTAIRYGLDQIYNNSLYFDRAFDYLPLGGYFEVFAGKIASLFYPASINNVKLLFVYKIIPVIFYLLIMLKIKSIGIKDNINSLIAAVSLPIIIIVSLYGENDVIIIYFLILSITAFEKRQIHQGMLFSIITLVIKQTSLFFVLSILFYYFIRSSNKKQYITQTVLWGAGIFTVFFSPFIVKGNLIDALNSFFSNTLSIISPLSCKAFNSYSIIPGAQFMDFNYKLGLFSIKTYALGALAISLIFIIIKLRKRNIWQIMTLIAIIWYNLHVGLHTHHMIYLLIFLVILSVRSRLHWIYAVVYSLILALNMLLTQSIVTMNLFGIPRLPIPFMVIFAGIQLIVSAVLFVNIIRHDPGSNTAISEPVHFRIWVTVILLVLIVSAFMPGRYLKNEKEWVSDIINEGHLLNYSKDHYIEADIVSHGPFSNYLGIRMSDSSHFTVDNTVYDSIEFSAGIEYGSVAKLIVSDSVIDITESKQSIVLRSNNDKWRFEASNNRQYSIIAIYNIKYFK